MARRAMYYTLIGSLPNLPSHFGEAERAPISRLGLVERLKMLEPNDSKVIEKMANFLAWERQPLEVTDADVLRKFDQFMETVENPFAQSLIRRTMYVRSVIGALRCRRLKLEPPRGIEPITSRIARNWTHPDFRLGHEYPWITEVDGQLNSSTPFDLERTILNIGWRYTSRLAERFHFTFESVVLYLIRWEIVYRWTRQSAEVGEAKFEQLASEAMGENAQLFEV